MIEKLKSVWSAVTSPLDWFLNKNLIASFFDGYKAQIAGVLIGIAVALDAIAGFLPSEISVQILAISTALKAIAGYLGFVGGVGKLAKIGKK